MARGRFISLCRRCSQFTAGLSTAARKRAMTNQPMKVRTCQSRKSPPSTSAAVKRATATVRATCDVGKLSRTRPSSAGDTIGGTSSVSVVLGLPSSSLGSGTLAFSGSIGGVLSSESRAPRAVPLPCKISTLSYIEGILCTLKHKTREVTKYKFFLSSLPRASVLSFLPMRTAFCNRLRKEHLPDQLVIGECHL